MMAKLGTDRVGRGGWVVGAALPRSIIGKRLYPSILGSVEGYRSWTNWNTVVG